MNTLLVTTNIRKELWEYKKIFLWLPIILATLAVLTPVVSYFWFDLSTEPWLYKFERLAQEAQRQEFHKIAYSLIVALFMPFILVVTLVQFYYFTACLYDERRDMSILFWRSLPVSDAMSVGVKLLVGALVLPALFMLAATLTLLLFLFAFFILCTVLSLGYDLSLWGLWSSSNIGTNLFSIWLNILPYALWMFPVYAWLMLVSMYAKKAPFLWAILPVVILLLIEAFVVRYFNLNSLFFTETLINYFSISSHTAQSYVSSDTGMNMLPFKLLIDKFNIMALVIGCAFIYLTYWLRARRSHG